MAEGTTAPINGFTLSVVSPDIVIGAMPIIAAHERCACILVRCRRPPPASNLRLNGVAARYRASALGATKRTETYDLMDECRVLYSTTPMLDALFSVNWFSTSR